MTQKEKLQSHNESDIGSKVKKRQHFEIFLRPRKVYICTEQQGEPVQVIKNSHTKILSSGSVRVNAPRVSKSK